MLGKCEDSQMFQICLQYDSNHVNWIEEQSNLHYQAKFYELNLRLFLLVTFFFTSRIVIVINTLKGLGVVQGKETTKQISSIGSCSSPPSNSEMKKRQMEMNHYPDFLSLEDFRVSRM